VHPRLATVCVGMMERLAKELGASGAPSVQNVWVPPDDAAWGQVFRLVGSDAMRGAVERRFGVRMAFQNCCRMGLFRFDATAGYAEFVSLRGSCSTSGRSCSLLNLEWGRRRPRPARLPPSRGADGFGVIQPGDDVLEGRSGGRRRRSLPEGVV
jgi:uncharacterized protein